MYNVTVYIYTWNPYFSVKDQKALQNSISTRVVSEISFFALKSGLIRYLGPFNKDAAATVKEPSCLLKPSPKDAIVMLTVVRKLLKAVLN